MTIIFFSDQLASIHKVVFVAICWTCLNFCLKLVTRLLDLFSAKWTSFNIIAWNFYRCTFRHFFVTGLNCLSLFFFVSAIRRGSMTGFVFCLSIVRFSYLLTFQTDFFFVERSSVFCDSRSFFLRLELPRVFFVKNVHVVPCGRLEARGQVRPCFHTLSLPWQGINCTIWRSRSQRITISPPLNFLILIQFSRQRFTVFSGFITF